jgi:hypothetical protein
VLQIGGDVGAVEEAREDHRGLDVLLGDERPTCGRCPQRSRDRDDGTAEEGLLDGAGLQLRDAPAGQAQLLSDLGIGEAAGA